MWSSEFGWTQQQSSGELSGKQGLGFARVLAFSVAFWGDTASGEGGGVLAAGWQTPRQPPLATPPSPPAVACAVAGWSGWSRCVKPCQVSYRVRQRHILQEPRNGGVPCPPLEERAGCAEYWSRQGVECQQSLLPALVTTGSYGKERGKRGVPRKQAAGGYCVRFRLGPIPGSCGQVKAPHAQWTRYLTQGHTVCVKCEWPAQDARSRRCYGDGGEAGGNKVSLWQAAGHPRCRGVWERLGQLRDCSCPAVHSLIFI
ncbi:somatomedin-B and thrombospondin type-1 domain-containing protein-like [Microcebus murinus]|uniref:somatomedin-B and thrombospondin type-1 domain-containing protein-like n=1 Tax=Microcebus murinus TaxID=30608 RepID=UPI003F6D4C59